MLGTYRDGFPKYSRRVPVERIGRVIESIPWMLCRARLATRVQASTGMGIPLGGDIRERILKVLFLDSGLVCAALGLTLQRVSGLKDLVLVNEGGLAEQSVGQAIRAALPHFCERTLHYWGTD